MRAGYTACCGMLLTAGILSAGCSWVPRNDLTACETQARSFAEQNRALLAELENNKAHLHHMEDRVRRAEEDLALLDEESSDDRRKLVNYERERKVLQRQIGGLPGKGDGRIPLGVSARLAELSRRNPDLRYDPETGVAKFDHDVLFASADAVIEHDAEALLREFAGVFQAEDARDLKIMIVGHTDDQAISKKPARNRYRTNWELSTARALSVAEFLRRAGLPEDRMGVAGFAGNQPIAPNEGIDRARNRRVEIFIIPPEMPVVGWTESMTSLY
ncbi:MAG: flagellar motor protein MotB [Pirellulales bacterium]